MCESNIPIKMLSAEDYQDFKHILECCHENEQFYNSGTFLLRSIVNLEMVPLFDINDYMKTELITDRKFELKSDLKSRGTYSVYSWPLKKEITLSQYFTKHKRIYGTTALDIYDNIWKQIKTSNKKTVHDWYYSVDNLESLSKRNQLIDMNSLAKGSLLGQFDCDTQRIDGIFTPYAYYGTAGSIAGIHVEDSDLMSININIWGAPKHWLSTGESSRADVIKVMSESDDTFKTYPHHYRCKMMVIAAEKLLQERIPIYTGYQHVNDTIVTLCGAFHQVTNTGKC